MFAIQEGALDAAQALLGAGASPAARDNDGSGAIAWLAKSSALKAQDRQRADVIRAVAARGISANEHRTQDWPPLLSVAYGEGADDQLGHPATLSVRALLQAGANANGTNVHGVSAMHIVAEHGFIATMNALLDAGANVNAADDTGDTPLHKITKRPFDDFVPVEGDFSCWNGDSARVAKARLLLSRGASANIANRAGQTPRDLLRAAKPGSPGNDRCLKRYLALLEQMQ